MWIKESIRRSALWAAYGDALGFITEMAGSASVVARRTGKEGKVTGLIPWVRRIGGEFGIDIELPLGCYSDDTQLRLATSRSIRGNGLFDIEMLTKVEIPVWLSYSLGAGVGSKAAAENLKKKNISWYSNFFKVKNSQYINGGGNGAAMRIQPHVWCSPKDKGNTSILNNVVRNTIATHGHSRAIVGAAFHALSLRHAMLYGNVPGLSEWNSFLDTIRWIPNLINSDRDLSTYWLPTWEKESGQTIENAINQSVTELAIDITTIKKSLEVKGSGNSSDTYAFLVKEIGCLDKRAAGSAPKTALLASYLSYAFKDCPHDGLIEAVNVLGSDTDTIATMSGAILGMVAQSDPPGPVIDAAYLEEEAYRLYQLSQGFETSSFMYPDLLYWEPPNTNLDTIGQYDGKWMLKGIGSAEPISSPIRGKKGKYPGIWQWFKLQFGQTVLVKRRSQVIRFDQDAIPVRIVPSKVSTKADFQIERISGRKPTMQGGLWDKYSVDSQVNHAITVENATNTVIESGFRKDVIGSMLLQLAEQRDGIDKCVAFAAIIAKLRQARSKKRS